MENTNPTKAVTPDEELILSIIKRRSRVIDKLEKNESYSTMGGGQYALKHEIIPAIKALYHSVKTNYDSENKESAKKFSTLINSSKTTDVIDAFYLLDAWLYEKGVTQFDKIKQYDSSNVEVENRSKGM